MRTSGLLVRRAMAVGVVVLATSAGSGFLTAPMASAQDFSGTCESGRFTASPRDGSTVLPGQTIIYHVDVKVSGGDVLGCARDVLVSPLLDFVSVRPGGAYFPPNSEHGPMVIVDYSGPLAPGTYHGNVRMRVRADVRPGAVIETSSGAEIRHVVRGRCDRQTYAAA